MLLSWLAQGVGYGTALAALAWVVSKTLLRRARPAVHAALWTLVLLKFLVPFGVSLPGPAAASVQAVLVALPAGAGSGSALVPGPTFSLSAVLLALWLCGVLLAVTRRVRSHLRLRRKVAALPLAPAALVEVVASLARALGAPVPQVRVDAAGPFVLGVVRPVLVVPPGVEGARLEAMLVHELTHLRRRDGASLLLQAAVEVLFFFWPVVRLVSRRLALAREQACDEAVLARGSLTAPDYAQLLLERRPVAAPALSMFDAGSQLERRIGLLLAAPRPASWRWAAVGLALVGTAGVLTRPALAAEPVHEESAEVKLVKETFSQHGDSVRLCFEEAGVARESAGELVLWFRLNERGTVDRLMETVGTTLDERVARCIVDRAAWWTYTPAPAAPVELTFTLKFEPGC